eukprot:scaffold407731_cov39-Prasinocladus_malaysianus.AAC.1
MFPSFRLCAPATCLLLAAVVSSPTLLVPALSSDVQAVVYNDDFSDEAAYYLPSDGKGGRRQLVAMIPKEGAKHIQWMDLRWPGGSATSVSQVTAAPANTSDPAVADALGAWADLIFDDILYMTCKATDDKQYMICLDRKLRTTPVDYGCCADSLLIIDKTFGV